MSREGQLDSQKPHSMHLSTMLLAGGLGFKFFKCTSGSCNKKRSVTLGLLAMSS